jgi:DNA-binding NtrC family response regulator
MAKILVLDDVQDAVGLMSKVLKRQGHSVVTFTEEQEAIAHVENNEVELAILDIKLKKMSGIQVLEEMKKRRPQLKAIMLTGYPTLETARTAMELGAGEYCVKPIDITELKEKVAEVLRQ